MGGLGRQGEIERRRWGGRWELGGEKNERSGRQGEERGRGEKGINKPL